MPGTRGISPKRYQNVAKKTCRRARKGFSVRINPDAHWSCALYRGLDYIQLKEGSNKVLLNRDDQSGFRLDTTYDHKHSKTITLTNRPALTTRTDFVNDYPSVIQTTLWKLTPASRHVWALLNPTSLIQRMQLSMRLIWNSCRIHQISNHGWQTGP